jgi:hypothetical protein
MRRVERVKIFTGADAGDVEKLYNDWYDAMLKERSEIPALDGVPLKILDRVFTIRNYDGEETFALLIFYEHMLTEAQEKGEDRGGNSAVASAFPGEKARQSRR